MGIAADYDTVGGDATHAGPVAAAGNNDSDEPANLAAWTEFHETVERMDEYMRETSQPI